jgi:protein-tyrosine phosphatase
MTSANRHGERPTSSAEEAEAAFGAVDYVVDGGPSRLAEASSVLRLGRGKFELLRAGLFTDEQLRAAAGLRIAFVCTGNTCRSPMAEALARELLSKRLQAPIGKIGDFGFTLQSMGVAASPGASAAKLAVDVLAEDGIDLAGHGARTATLEEVMRLDRVYGMTRSHVDELRRLLPPGKDKHVQMLDPEGEDIPDPIGGGRAEYVSAAKRIRTAIEARLDEWA